MFASPFFTSGTRRHPADHRHAGRIARRQLADADHAMGHADGGHAAGRLQRGLAWAITWAFMLNSLSFLFSAGAIWQIAVPDGFRAEREAAATAARPWHEYRRGPGLHAQRPADDGHRR